MKIMTESESDCMEVEYVTHDILGAFIYRKAVLCSSVESMEAVK